MVRCILVVEFIRILIQTISGCDSILTIDLTINNSYVGDTSVLSSCDSLVWNGTVYDTSGVYTDTFTNS